jgi:cobalt-zinc-cadmium efflux system outer membrane protein
LSTRTICVLAAAGAVIAACATPTRSRAWLDAAVQAQTGHHLGRSAREASAPLPPGCSLEDGLDPDEAASVALWRSPTLQVELTRLDSALADLDEAARLPNPRLSFSFLAPLDPRQLALIVAWPIEAIWQVPFRSEAATRELEVVAESLVQSALDLERTIRLSHADALTARVRVGALEELALNWQVAAALAASRANAGDISQAEASAAAPEAAIARDAAARGRADVVMADARLLAGLGAPWPTLPALVAPEAAEPALPKVERLVARALEARPDLRAASLAVHAAAARARWERSRAFSLVATLDGQAPRGELGPNFSGGVQLDVPIFSINQGGVGRAEAALQRAAHDYLALRLTVPAEVVVARAALERAKHSIEAYASVMEALSEASRGARAAFEHGDAPYLVVVDATRREGEAKLRRVELAIGVLLACFAVCNGSHQATHAPAPAVARMLPPTTPEALATVVLSRESQAALGLEVTTVRSVSAQESSVVPGDVLVPPDRDIVLTAPTSGRIVPPATGAPRPGQAVSAGQILLSLIPMANVDRNAKAGAARDVAAARANLELAQARAQRAEVMVRDLSGSRRSVEDARAQRQIALAELEAAEARLRTLAGGALDSDVSLPIRSPVDGIVRALRVAPGQALPSGTALVDVAGTGRWVRAHLSASDNLALRSQGEARVRRIGSFDSVPLSFVLTAPSADPARGSVDRFFALPSDSDWTPGERVLVELFAPTATQSLAVPASAVVRDAEGGAWVYEQTGDESFRRQRVEPMRRDGDLLLLARGPAREMRVVSTGAIELWGFELGADR